MSAIPNDRRTRQLFIDAAIKRAQAKARTARLQAADLDDSEPGSTATALRTTPWVPGQRHIGSPDR